MPSSPTDSRFPSRADGTLVEPEPASAGFPAIPGVGYAGTLNRLRLTDCAVEPEKEGAAYPVFVPRVDADGNDVAGIRMPAVEAPSGTYLGWNLRREGFGEGELCSLTGSYIPFAETRAERLASGDPRLSIEERYPTHEAFVSEVRKAVECLVEDGFLLQEDAKRCLEKAERQERADILIRGGRLIDGTGSPWVQADLAIRGDTIYAVGRTPTEADLTIDAAGKIVCPGFIDMHAHSEYRLIVDPRGSSKVTQGVTTEVLDLAPAIVVEVD